MRYPCRLAVLLCSMTLVACTSMRTTVDTTTTEPVSIGSRDRTLAPGDEVKVATKDGAQVELRITAVSAEFIEGTVQVPRWGEVEGTSKQSTRIPRTEVLRIERREFDEGKTALLAVVACTAAFVGAVVVMEFDYDLGFEGWAVGY